jgi:mevalonate kinase
MKVILENNLTPLQITVSGKWILAGEHAVLRGSEALVFPLNSRFLKLTYLPNEIDFQIDLKDQENSELRLIIWSVIEKGLKKLNLTKNNLKGRLIFESHILFGAGMGASATLCVALTRLFCKLGHLQHEDQYEFARDLENLFHGESSGVDVAVTLYNRALLFSRNQGFKEFQIQNKPYLFLSHTGARGVTKDCVEQVKTIFLQNPELAQKIDDQMKRSVGVFKELLLQTEVTAFSKQMWIKTLNEAHDCFKQWGLVNETVIHHQNQLFKCGAEAVKLTGSGGGGFMLSYWSQPPVNVDFDLIPCFTPNAIEGEACVN